MPQTAVSTDLLHPLNVITELRLKVLRENLTVLSSLKILLSVEEPKRDLELTGVLDDSDKLFDLIGSELSGTLVHVNLGLFADKVTETTSDTLDLGNSEDDIALTLNVGVENTQNVLEFGTLHKRRHDWCRRDGNYIIQEGTNRMSKSCAFLLGP